MKIPLGDYNAMVGRENILKPTIGNENLHQDIDNNGVRRVKFAYHSCQLRTKLSQHPAVKVNSICGGNYWGSSMWISTQQVSY
jgi:hypothetical protein